MYFQMPQVGVADEYYTLKSPASLGDLLERVVQKHPLISSMTPTMMILIDGVPGYPATQLKDGDEVDLVPAIVGG